MRGEASVSEIDLLDVDEAVSIRNKNGQHFGEWIEIDTLSCFHL